MGGACGGQNGNFGLFRFGAIFLAYCRRRSQHSNGVAQQWRVAAVDNSPQPHSARRVALAVDAEAVGHADVHVKRLEVCRAFMPEYHQRVQEALGRLIGTVFELLRFPRHGRSLCEMFLATEVRAAGIAGGSAYPPQ